MAFENFQVVFAIFLISVLNYYSAQAQVPKCKGMDMKVYEKDRMWMMECMREVEAKMPKEAFMMPCFRKCMVIKRGIVNDFGEVSKEKAAEFVMMTAPDMLHKDLVMKTQNCVDMHGGKIKEWKMSCESYVPVCDCMAMAFSQACMM